MNMKQHKNKVWGTTLVELMVSLCVSAILLSAVFTIYINVKKLQQQQESVNYIIENSIVLDKMFTNVVKHAGVIGCNNLNNLALYFQNESIKTKFNITSDRSIYVYKYTDAKKIKVIPKTVKLRMNTGSDILWVNSAVNIQDVKNIYKLNNKIIIDGEFKVNQGEVIALSDCNTVFFLTALSDSYYNKEYLHSVLKVELPEFIPLSLMRSYKIGKLQSILLYIGDTNRKTANNYPIYALYQSDINGSTVELIEGVQNITFTYLEDIKQLKLKARYHSFAPGAITTQNQIMHKDYEYTWRLRV
jgi:Tfp pilus assembly protein PilE